MTDDFEVFGGRASRGRRGSYVTLQKAGIIVLSPEAWDALGSPEAVELLFSQERRAVGIRAAAPDAAHAYRTRKVASTLGRLVTAKAFFTAYGIALEKAQRFPATMNGAMLTVPLGKERATA